MSTTTTNNPIMDELNAQGLYDDEIAINANMRATAESIEKEAGNQISTLAEASLKHDQILASQQNEIEAQTKVAGNAGVLADIAQELEQVQKKTNQVAVKQAGLTVTSAKMAQSMNAPVRTNYSNTMSDPATAEAEAYQRRQIAIYSKRLRELNNDTSFTGQIKRMALVGKTQEKLDRARQSYGDIQQQKMSAMNSFTANLRANQAFATSSNAVERAELSKSLVEAEAAQNILKAKEGTTVARNAKLSALLRLDEKFTAKYLKEAELLRTRGLDSKSNLAALHTKLNAQQWQLTAAKKSKDLDWKAQTSEDYRAYMLDNGYDDFLKKFPNFLSPEVAESKIGIAWLASRARTGTRTEYAADILQRSKNGLALNDTEIQVTKLVRGQLKDTINAINNKFEAEFAALPIQDQNSDKGEDLLKERDKQLASLGKWIDKDLDTIETQSELYTIALDNLKNNTSSAIYNGAIEIPDLNKIVQNENFDLGRMISPEFAAILQTDEFKAIDLGYKFNVDVPTQLNSKLTQIAQYLLSDAEVTGVTGKLVVTPAISNKIKVVSQGLADYYGMILKDIHRSELGLDSNLLPSINIANLNGAKVTLDNQGSIEMELRRIVAANSFRQQSAADYTSLPIGAGRDLIGSPLLNTTKGE